MPETGLAPGGSLFPLQITFQPEADATWDNPRVAAGLKGEELLFSALWENL